MDRLLGAFPLIAVGLAVLVFYAVEAYSRKTPWVFSDELEWTQLSRSIAETGKAPSRRSTSVRRCGFAPVCSIGTVVTAWSF